MAQYGRCINLIVQLLTKYNPDNQSLEHFLEESAEGFQALNHEEEQFVLDVLSGCVQYKTLLDVVVQAFYARDGKHYLLSEQCLYAVISYIAIFKMEELGLQTFGRIVRCQDFTKMDKFLRFFFNVLNLNTWIRDEWSQIFDSDYVKENLINPLLKWQPEVLNLLEVIESKRVKGPNLAKGSNGTEVKEFNLTKPKPRTIPVPQKIPAQKLHQPVPESTYKSPKEQEVLEEKKLRNRQKAEELLIEANMGQYKCANPEKSEKTKRVLSEIMKEEENKLAVNKMKAQQGPLKKVDNVPVRLNAAAILREAALYQRQVEEELNRIEKLVDGARDPSEFLEWQRQMQAKDLERQLADIECRRLEGKLSREEAVLARQNLIQDNKRKAFLKKEETEKLMRQYAEKRLQEEKEMRDLVEQVSEGHKNTKQARLKLQKYKQQIVQEVAEESRELLRQALEEAQEELKKKFELIREIRAMESVPIIRQKFVDLTQTAGHRLNCEMSIVELRERLALLKEAERKAEEEKRDQILEEKQSKQQLLLDTLEQISLHRAAQGKASLLRLEEKKTKSQLGKAAIANDERVTELQRKLEEKMTERKRQAEALKLNPQRNTVKSSKNSYEEKHWKELEESRERQAQLLQYGVVSRETAHRMAAYQAARNGSSQAYVIPS
ncbi:cilia- and flagella-associated protein 99 [Bufo gargarizans]|uniref:cilia- and flagella-associated protein 99 n=1 Tax=Bufo gargarizans TaxID=30331 RepID=UPI001CF2EBE9|nr:cilia- and flagella-associated protein 99 [Bufo gargarizans]XP_044151466.1 cilia- and flagella-associated protein 99 [Bufo gargarizans]